MTTGDAPRLAAVTGETVDDHMGEFHGTEGPYDVEDHEDDHGCRGWVLPHAHTHDDATPGRPQ